MNVDDPRIIAGLGAQARERQAALAGGARRLGWKAGLGTTAAMAKVGTDAPLVGFLTDASLVPGGQAVAIDGWGAPTLEPEVALRLGADVPAGASRDDVLAAIDAVGPAIELIDLGPPDDVEAVLAGNIFHRAVLLGPLAPWPGAPTLRDVRLEVRVAGQTPMTDIDPRAALGDLADVVRALADQLPLAGEAMRAGDVVITGSAMPAIALAGGEDVEVSLPGIGHVGVAVPARS
jgi:2-keto-4-pentenoate hydratase